MDNLEDARKNSDLERSRSNMQKQPEPEFKSVDIEGPRQKS